MARTLPKSMAGIFKDLAANRRDARDTRKHFVVVGLKKNGQPRQVLATDMAFNATDTRAQAEGRLAAMEQMNPGKTFTIVMLP